MDTLVSPSPRSATELRFQRWSLRRSGKVTARGWVFAATALAAVSATAHAGVARWHKWRSDQAWSDWQQATAQGSDAGSPAHRALAHLEARERWGFMQPSDIPARLQKGIRHGK